MGSDTGRDTPDGTGKESRICMDDEKARDTRPDAAPAESTGGRGDTGTGNRRPSPGVKRRPEGRGRGGNPQREDGGNGAEISRNEFAQNAPVLHPTAQKSASDNVQSRGSRTVWSSDRRRGGRMPVPAGSVASAAASSDCKPNAGTARSDGKPTSGKTGVDRAGNEKAASGKPTDRTTTPTEKKGRSAAAQPMRATGRPARVPHRAARAEELPRMDNLLIDDTPVEPDISPDTYTPSNDDIDRILSYELYTPQSRQIPDVLPDGKSVIVGVRFRPGGKTYFFDPGTIRCQNGQSAIVETARGQEFGEICMGNRMVDTSLVVQPLRPLVRLATEEDVRHNRQNRQREADAFQVGIEKIRAHKLDMKLVAAQYTFDNSKLLFYFTSDGRVDFRELVKDLAGVFHIRIELRQIGIRDEARMIGGLGPCGRPLCCSTFLSDFGQVSMKMAKEQNLSLNASKISGCCGRLMCCLRYEHETYQEEMRRSPAPGSFVQTPDGPGVVTEVLPILGEVKVSLRNQPDSAPHRYKREQISLQPPDAARGEARNDRYERDDRDDRNTRDDRNERGTHPERDTMRPARNVRPAEGSVRPPVSAPEDDLTPADKATPPVSDADIPGTDEAE